MSYRSRSDSRATPSSVSKMCFGIASLAFVGSFACAAINQALSGWMAVAGMAGLGLFYLAIGVLNLGHAPASLFNNEQDSSSAASHSHSRKYDGDSLANNQFGSTQKRDRESEAQPDELVEV